MPSSVPIYTGETVPNTRPSRLRSKPRTVTFTIIEMGEVYLGIDLRYYVVHDDLIDADRAFWSFNDAVAYVLVGTWRI